MTLSRGILRFSLCASLVTMSLITWAQDDPQPQQPHLHFSGDVNATNNGFSFIPTFTLGKPATVIDLSAGGDRLSFDPQFRFDLNGFRPWSFVFIWRYNLIESPKFQLRLGGHLPAIAFIHQTITVNGVTKDQLYSQRFITPELTTNYKFGKHLTVGTYYLLGIGVEKTDQTRITHFISLRVFVDNLHVTPSVYFKWNPQFYYLWLDGIDGAFTAQTVTLAVKDFPLSVSSTINKALHTNIVVKDFDWNIALTYVFETELERKR